MTRSGRSSWFGCHGWWPRGPRRATRRESSLFAPASARRGPLQRAQPGLQPETVAEVQTVHAEATIPHLLESLPEWPRLDEATPGGPGLAAWREPRRQRRPLAPEALNCRGGEVGLVGSGTDAL